MSAKKEAPFNGLDHGHPLADVLSPYSCAICKACTDLISCGSCQSVRFCSREHQREYFPRHQAVCRFLSNGRKTATLQGTWNAKEWIPEALDVWRKQRRREPEPWELQQLCTQPYCRRCHKIPATIFSPECCFAAYCSEGCLEEDAAERGSWRYLQVAVTAMTAQTYHQANGRICFELTERESPLPADFVEKTWEGYVEFASPTCENTPFLKLPLQAQQVIIDSLSYPLIALEALDTLGKPLDAQLKGLQHFEVHILGATRAALANLEKYEEWLHRSGETVSSLHLHFVGPQVPLAEGGTKCKWERRFEDCERSIEVHLHRRSVSDWVAEKADSKPLFRIAFSPSLGRSSGAAREEWVAAIRTLTALGDFVPLIITESVVEDLLQDEQVLEENGMTSLVSPTLSKFPSPLALFDDYRTKEENSLGLIIANMSFAVFEATIGGPVQDKGPAGQGGVTCGGE